MFRLHFAYGALPGFFFRQKVKTRRCYCISPFRSTKMQLGASALEATPPKPQAEVACTGAQAQAA